MGLLITGIVLALGIVFGLGIKNDDDKPILPFAVRGLIALVVFLGFTIFAAIRSVPTGFTGVVTTFGRVEDYTLDAGIHFLAPWRKVTKMDNRTQIQTYDLSCFSSDIQEVAVTYSVNYQISKADAQTIYKTIGLDYPNTVMFPKVQEAVKGVMAKYTAEQIISVRGTLSQQIEDVLTASLAQYNIEVVSTSLANIDFTDAFTNAVEAKQVAEQNKLRAQTEQAQANLEAQAAAERQVIKAQADADSAILAAKADAEVQQIGADAAEYAGKKEAAILSNIGEQMNRYPGLERYYYFQKWNGELPETMLGSDANILYNLDQDVNTAAPAATVTE